MIKYPSALKLHLLANQKPELHGLRCIAILMVVQFHAAIYIHVMGITLPQSYVQFTRCLWFGMDGFFILSGYLIGTMLLSGENLKSLSSIKRFYIRRAFRIFPLYYVILSLGIYFVGLTPERRSAIFRELFYLTNYPISENYLMPWSWSLSVEEHFYLAVPFLILLIKSLKSDKRILVLCCLWFSGGIIRLLIASTLEPPWKEVYVANIYAPTHCRLDIFVAGVFIAYVEKYKSKQIKQLFSLPYLRWVLFFIFWVCIYVLFKPHAREIKNIYFEALLPGTFTSIAYTCLLLWLIHNDSFFKKILSQPFFRYAATLGYGVYLIHIPVFVLVGGVFSKYYTSCNVYNGGWLICILTGFILCFVFAYFLHIIVEKPFLWLRDLFFE